MFWKTIRELRERLADAQERAIKAEKNYEDDERTIKGWLEAQRQWDRERRQLETDLYNVRHAKEEEQRRLLEAEPKKVGQIVKLKTGNVNMTITRKINASEMATCSWMYNNGEIRQGDFHVDSLVRVIPRKSSGDAWTRDGY